MDDYSIDQFKDILQSCSGFVFTGGADVHPSHYGQASRISDCIVDEVRDQRELAMIELCSSLQLPTLAICRGVQIYNVYAGGSLIIDIPNDTETSIEHGKINGIDSFHEISIEPGTQLKKICKVDSISVNSAHHQAVKALPEIFCASSIANDGIIEAFEWSDSNGKPFLLAIQWHPERLEYDHPCSLSIAKHFLMEAEAFELLFLQY